MSVDREGYNSTALLLCSYIIAMTAAAPAETVIPTMVIAAPVVLAPPLGLGAGVYTMPMSGGRVGGGTQMLGLAIVPKMQVAPESHVQQKLLPET